MNNSKKYFINKFLSLALIVFILIILIPFAYSQENTPPTSKASAISKIDGVTVVLGD